MIAQDDGTVLVERHTAFYGTPRCTFKSLELAVLGMGPHIERFSPVWSAYRVTEVKEE